MLLLVRPQLAPKRVLINSDPDPQRFHLVADHRALSLNSELLSDNVKRECQKLSA